VLLPGTVSITIKPTRNLLLGGTSRSMLPFCLSVKGSIAMWKKLLWASALTGLLAAAAIPLQTTSADACRSGCREAAKAQFPSDSRTRKEYKRYCKSQYKAYKSAGGSGA
jgi:hypothetical protein